MARGSTDLYGDTSRALRLRQAVYLSDLIVLVACIRLAVIFGSWSWGPAAAQVAVTAIAFLISLLTDRMVIAIFRPTPEELARTGQARKRRQAMTRISLPSLGLATAILAGSVRSYWTPALFALMVLV